MKTEKKQENFLGGLFKGLGQLIELADKVSKQGEFSIPGQKDLKGVYGFTIRTLVGANGESQPVIQPFGNIKKTPQGPIVEEEREPIIDVFDAKKTIQVVAELPGVTEQDIHYEIHGDVLLLSTTGTRKYYKEILLKHPVAEKAEVKYKNGMLELKLKKISV